MAGPRESLFFDPQQTRAGIVTCGGLCPGLNNVVRSLFRELRDGYGVPEILGFRMGYRGLDPGRALEPFVLTYTLVDEIHKHGGTLLGTSRGAVNIAAAIRFDDMFAQLVLPLRDRRSVHVEADYAKETATQYRKHTYDFRNIDVIVLEGIYLLKREFTHYYDFSVWVECSFKTALKRALKRGQEGLPPAETIRAFETIYFPAQKIHFERDHPKQAAAMVFDNDAQPA
jgi:Phosphofructokinase